MASFRPMTMVTVWAVLQVGTRGVKVFSTAGRLNHPQPCTLQAHTGKVTKSQ